VPQWRWFINAVPTGCSSTRRTRKYCMRFALVRRQHQILDDLLTMGLELVPPVRNLGIYLDSDLSMRMHVTRTESSCFTVLRQTLDYGSATHSSSWPSYSSVGHITVGVECRRAIGLWVVEVWPAWTSGETCHLLNVSHTVKFISKIWPCDSTSPWSALAACFVTYCVLASCTSVPLSTPPYLAYELYRLADVQQVTWSPSPTVFRRRLKMELFTRS